MTIPERWAKELTTNVMPAQPGVTWEDVVAMYKRITPAMYKRITPTKPILTRIKMCPATWELIKAGAVKEAKPVTLFGEPSWPGVTVEVVHDDQDYPVGTVRFFDQRGEEMDRP